MEYQGILEGCGCWVVVSGTREKNYTRLDRPGLAVADYLNYRNYLLHAPPNQQVYPMNILVSKISTISTISNKLLPNARLYANRVSSLSVIIRKTVLVLVLLDRPIPPGAPSIQPHLRLSRPLRLPEQLRLALVAVLV